MNYQRRDEEYNAFDWDCGMTRYKGRGIGNKELIIVNDTEQRAWQITEPNGEIVGFTLDDLDMQNICATDCAHLARKMIAYYRFDVERFKNGKAEVIWTLQPEGCYYADEDGFGSTDDEEVCIKAVIDTHCQVLEKFKVSERVEIPQIVEDDELVDEIF